MPLQNDTALLPTVCPSPTLQSMSHQYGFRRGDRVKIVSGKHAGATGVVDSRVFQYSVDYPEELGAVYHVVLDTGNVFTVRVGQVTSGSPEDSRS